MIQFLRAVLTGVTTAVIWVRAVLLARSTLGASFAQRLWALRHGFTPDEYVLFGLRHNNPRDYISWGRTVRLRELNAPFGQILNDVVVCHEAMSHRLPTRQVFGCLGPGGAIISHGDELVDGPDGIFSLLERHDAVLKWGQEGVLQMLDDRPAWLLQHRDDGLLLNRQPASREQIAGLLRGLDGYCLLEQVEPHPYLRQWGASSASEIEVVVVCEPKPEVVWAGQRIGFAAPGSERVQWTASIDLGTGSLGVGRSTRRLGDEPAVAGVVVPGWAGIKRSVEAVAATMPYLRLITFRVVPLPDGFVLTGACAFADTTTIQLWGGLASSSLGRLLGAGS